jgi:hypothetical protein
VKAWIFNQMWDELTDNCVTEGTKKIAFLTGTTSILSAPKMACAVIFPYHFNL